MTTAVVTSPVELPARLGRPGVVARAARRVRRDTRPTTARVPGDHEERARRRETARVVEAIRHAALTEAALGGRFFR
ncbi:hypothetical protein [Cellulomonas edaphi]|uniref:Uncharacterized protein n=1 Tax=Cellulomonas edaphi TaxID=3053468 RepID=A0ABT7S8B5_9CELL|nr:hypothetical protein [Cellulomons edaphi]MDM7831870.1 hypothetical protein [Cellulomons edaphi]